MTSLTILDGTGATKTLNVGTDPATSNINNTFSIGFSITNPTSTLTLPATTTAYAAGQLIANSATAGSVVVPSFSIPNTAGGFHLPSCILTTNDPAWAVAAIQIDFWRSAPTLTNGDRGVYKIATGSANFLSSYVFTMTGAGDGCYALGVPKAGNPPAVRLASGASVFWTAQALIGTGAATAASGVFTLTAGLNN